MSSRDDSRGEELILELLRDPHQFFALGKPNDLLNQYYNGFALETIKPLLVSPNLFVMRSAIWVAAELGAKATPLAESVIGLLNHADFFVRAYALDVVAVCCSNQDPSYGSYFVAALSDSSKIVRTQAMFLMTNIDEKEFQAIAVAASSPVMAGAAAQFAQSLASGHHLTHEQIKSALSCGDLVARKLGAVASARLRRLRPELLSLVQSINDDDLIEYLSMLQ